MSGSTTPRLGLPYIAAGQASPEVALATALNRLDCLTQGVVQSVGTNTPPGSPAQGATYILGASPTGAWAGRANDVAYYVGTGWVIFDPAQGWEFFNVADATRYRWSGSAWAIVAGGAGFGRADVVPPAVASWTWVNQGTATAVDRTYGISLTAPALTSENMRLLVRSAPTPPYTITARLDFLIPKKGNLSAGLVWRNSSGGQFQTFAWGNDAGNDRLFRQNFTNATTNSASPFLSTLWTSKPNWMRIGDDGANRSISLSVDGDEWLQIESFARTDHITPDQVGLCMRAFNGGAPNLPVAMTLFSWQVG
jgi:hypothetical protein